MRIKIRMTNFFWTLILVLPIMDSLNGLINNGGNKGGISLGIIYRFGIILYCLFLLYKYNLGKQMVAYYLLFLIVLIMPLLINGRNTSEYLNMILRLILPMLLITTIETCNQNGVLKSNWIKELFLKWRYWFPMSLFIPYILGIGFSTYEQGTGYKGLYHAQNDIGYILVILYLFSIVELSKRLQTDNIVAVIVLLLCNLLLGLKSNYILVAVITMIYFMKSEKNKSNLLKKIVTSILVIIGVFIILMGYQDEIQLIIVRWQYFYRQKDFLSFLTSSRADRIIPTYNWIKSTLGLPGVLLGSGIEYQLVGLGVIEMDLADIFFQLGILGLFFVYGFYFSFMKRYHMAGFYKWGFLLSIIYSTLVGHVLESALSGMFFAIVCSGSMFEQSMYGPDSAKKNKGYESRMSQLI